MSEKASFKSFRSLQYSTERSNGVNSHLCGLTTIESARSQPLKYLRNSGTIAVDPAYAVSTCSQILYFSQMSAIASTGSTLDVEVVPMVGITQIGTKPSLISSSIASDSLSGIISNRSLHSIFRRDLSPRPSVIAPLSIDE